MANLIETRKHVARNVQRLRKADGLSQEALAAKVTEAGLPMNLKTLSRIERGDRGIDVEDLTALARALGTSPSFLLSDPDERLEQEGRALVDAWEQAKHRRHEELRNLEAEITRRWSSMREYAAQSADRRQAIERVLVRSMGDDEVGRPMGEALVQRLSDELEEGS